MKIHGTRFLVIGILLLGACDGSTNITETSKVTVESIDSSFHKPHDTFAVDDSIEVNDSMLGKLVGYLESQEFIKKLSTFYRSDSIVKNRHDPNETDTVILYKSGENHFRFYANRYKTIFSDFYFKKHDDSIKEAVAGLLKLIEQFGYNPEQHSQYFSDLTGMMNATIGKDYIEFNISLD